MVVTLDGDSRSSTVPWLFLPFNVVKYLKAIVVPPHPRPSSFSNQNEIQFRRKNRRDCLFLTNWKLGQGKMRKISDSLCQKQKMDAAYLMATEIHLQSELLGCPLSSG
ncbi:ATP synthase epsilon chain [Striga asiatica]|uniref:ATP synthase epsilon chain n=1 Tax=Striga asiatica TaxID=4170 RepID=A0A5A7Q2P4_STRAF|nr:ATP synthase epsilon chain [Striga asiatica]